MANQAGETLDLSVTVASDGGSTPPYVENVSATDSLAVGDSGAVAGDVICSAGGGTDTVELQLSASGETVDVTLTRTVEIDCSGTTSTTTSGTTTV